MGVSTLHTSNIKGKIFASRVLCGLGLTKEVRRAANFQLKSIQNLDNCTFRAKKWNVKRKRTATKRPIYLVTQNARFLRFISLRPTWSQEWHIWAANLCNAITTLLESLHQGNTWLKAEKDGLCLMLRQRKKLLVSQNRNILWQLLSATLTFQVCS